MGFWFRLWLLRQPPGVRRTVFAVFALLGIAISGVGVVAGSWRAVGFGALAAVAWPLDLLVMRRIRFVVQRRVWGD